MSYTIKKGGDTVSFENRLEAVKGAFYMGIGLAIGTVAGDLIVAWIRSL